LIDPGVTREYDSPVDTGDTCPTCGEPVEAGATPPCPSCGSTLAGARPVAVEATREESLIALRLLESASMHPVLAYLDDTGVPHPIVPDEPFTGSAGLLLPVTTVYAVYVPEAEADESKQILEDARKSLSETDS
jgi:hypothetical protein